MPGRFRRTARLGLIPLRFAYHALSLYGRIWAPLPPAPPESADVSGSRRPPSTPPGHPERVGAPVPQTPAEAALARRLEEVFRGYAG
ncbi:DUF6059 family protein [Streptomyces sp. NPDC003691]